MGTNPLNLAALKNNVVGVANMILGALNGTFIPRRTDGIAGSVTDSIDLGATNSPWNNIYLRGTGQIFVGALPLDISSVITLQGTNGLIARGGAPGTYRLVWGRPNTTALAFLVSPESGSGGGGGGADGGGGLNGFPGGQGGTSGAALMMVGAQSFSSGTSQGGFGGINGNASRPGGNPALQIWGVRQQQTGGIGGIGGTSRESAIGSPGNGSGVEWKIALVSNLMESSSITITIGLPGVAGAAGRHGGDGVARDGRAGVTGLPGTAPGFVCLIPL